MEAKTSEQEKPVEKTKNGTKTGQNPAIRHPKTSAEYWKTKIGFRPGVGNGLYYLRLREGPRDAWICTDSANKAEAALKARDHWVRMKAIGLPALLRELDPDPIAKKPGTVGEAIVAAKSLSTVRPISFLGYVKRLRQVAGEIATIPKPKASTSRSSPEMAEWRKRVDAVRLDKLSADAVNAWKAHRINAAGSDPNARRSATVTADAAIRLARAVFSKDILAAGLGDLVELPSPLPFAGVAYGKSHRRFVSEVDPAKLFVAARTELEDSHPQLFLAFSLCLLPGLRRSEADVLTWPQFDADRGVVRIHETEYFQPKSEDATREIELDQVAIDIFKRARNTDANSIFVLKGRPFKQQNTAAPTYRADASPHFTWERLIEWLRAQGIKDPKPIHVLRKLAGSLVHEAHGIEQARGFLGHGDVSTTSRSYVAKTKKVVVSLSGDLSASKEAGK